MESSGAVIPPSESASASTPELNKINQGDPDLSALLRAMTTKTTIDTSSSSKNPTEIARRDNQGRNVPADSEIHPMAASVPTTITRSYKVLGIPTHIFCQIFSDRIVLGVTQLQSKPTPNAQPLSSGHIGSWVYCQASQSPIDPRQVDYELSTLLGGGGSNQSRRDNMRDEKEIYARRIAERLVEKKSIPGGTDRIVLLLGISLLSAPEVENNLTASTSVKRFKILIELLVELIETAVGVALGSTSVST